MLTDKELAQILCEYFCQLNASQSETALLNTLKKACTHCSSLCDEPIRNAFTELDPITKNLSHKRTVLLKRVIVSTCAEFQQTAFLEGIRVGAQLVMELGVSKLNRFQEDSADNTNYTPP